MKSNSAQTLRKGAQNWVRTFFPDYSNLRIGAGRRNCAHSAQFRAPPQLHAQITIARPLFLSARDSAHVARVTNNEILRLT